MKPLPGVVLKLLDTLPDAQAQKIVLNTDGNGQWDIEVYSRYHLREKVFGDDVPPPLPLKAKAVRHPLRDKKRH